MNIKDLPKSKPSKEDIRKALDIFSDIAQTLDGPTLDTYPFYEQLENRFQYIILVQLHLALVKSYQMVYFVETLDDPVIDMLRHMAEGDLKRAIEVQIETGEIVTIWDPDDEEVQDIADDVQSWLDSLPDNEE